MPAHVLSKLWQRLSVRSSVKPRIHGDNARSALPAAQSDVNRSGSACSMEVAARLLQSSRDSEPRAMRTLVQQQPLQPRQPGSLS